MVFRKPLSEDGKALKAQDRVLNRECKIFISILKIICFWSKENADDSKSDILSPHLNEKSPDIKEVDENESDSDSASDSKSKSESPSNISQKLHKKIEGQLKAGDIMTKKVENQPQLVDQEQNLPKMT